EAYYNLGNALYARFRHQDAIAAYEKALELKPDFCEAHNNYGNVLTESGEIDKGEQELNKALELNPEYPAAHNNLGNIYKQKGNRDKALVCYQKALEIDPNYPEAHRHLALSNKYTEKDLDHIDQIKKALDKEGIKDQERMHLHFALGKIYDDCKKFEDAFTNYKIGNDIRHKQL
ncbi:MAG: tetratricopeptide repeat protein, partial [Candidatus Dadabacteria bacterium]|nr:tetratricopeptide repeat protein [Candidatus Dadabacteria bacterium]